MRERMHERLAISVASAPCARWRLLIEEWTIAGIAVAVLEWVVVGIRESLTVMA